MYIRSANFSSYTYAYANGYAYTHKYKLYNKFQFTCLYIHQWTQYYHCFCMILPKFQSCDFHLQLQIPVPRVKTQKSPLNNIIRALPMAISRLGKTLPTWPLSMTPTSRPAQRFRQMTRFSFWCKQMSLSPSIFECTRRTWLLTPVPVTLLWLLPPTSPTCHWVRFPADPSVLAFCVVSGWIKAKARRGVMSSAATVRARNVEVWCWPSSLQQQSMPSMM